MSDTSDPSVGDRVDQKIEELRTEVNGRIDQLQASVDALSQRIDAAQGQQIQNPPPASV